MQKGTQRDRKIDNATVLNRRSFIASSAALLSAAAFGTGLAGCAPQQATPGGSDSNAGSSQGIQASWSTPPAPIEEASITETIQTEVLVIGGGNAGQYAACAAAEAGAKVLVLEKNSSIGTTQRYAIGAVDSRYQLEKGIHIDKRDLVETLCQYASHRCDQRLIKLWADKSGEVIDWLGDVLAEVEPSVSVHIETDTGNSSHGNYKTFATWHNVQTSDECLLSLDFVGQKLLKLGVEVMTETPMLRLEREGDKSGRVTGVIAQDKDGNYIRVNASKGVILCTGGYASNEEMMREANPLVANNCTTLLMPGALNAGDGIKAAVWVGAVKQEQGTAMVFDRGGVPPGTPGGCLYDSPGIEVHLGSQPFLKVNQKGERFCNESVPYDFIYAAACEQPNSTWCMVWDANWVEQVRQFHTIACARVFPSDEGKFLLFGTDTNADANPKSTASGFNTELFMEQVLIPAGVVVEAQTIEELAEKLQVPASAFVATVKRYNELCAKGEDEDFGKESYRMLPIDTPPYRGTTIGGELLCTIDGLRINEKIQVVDAQGEPIEGLYAAGNDSGGFFANNYPELIPGVNMGRGITFGFLAGQNAARS
ncbi:MAG: FAD-dependent oxidoreductase [Coriobacteriales bacterium]|jgi:succinate dehydrogenase/fumarate reductase flavoprotein subunit|nr:FAD-dependent oxidoreductase [Coriobacteriales bacterium]